MITNVAAGVQAFTSNAFLVTGDLVFANGSFGRTDLPGGDRVRLVRSIESVRETVGENLSELHTGHGSSVTRDPFSHVELALQAARR